MFNTQRWRGVCAVLGLVAFGCGEASDGSKAGDAGGSSLGSDDAPPFPGVTDFAGDGAWPTVKNAEGPSCTIHRPQPLGEEGRRHPVILWGNGTGGSPPIYDAALAHWASHGFIVAAANTANAGTGLEMLACLDYLIDENEREGSVYQGMVDLQHVGASGHSQGGGGTVMVGRDARITATAPLQPYTQDGTLSFDASSIGQQVGPMFLMSGGADNIATPQPHQQRVFDGVNTPVFWGTLTAGTHLGTALGNIGGYRGPSTAWFRLQLMGDESARDVFYGPDCELCTDPAWAEVQRSAEFE